MAAGIIKFDLDGLDEVEKGILSLAATIPKAASIGAMAGGETVRTIAITQYFRTKGEYTGTTKKGRKKYAALGAAVAEKLSRRTGNLQASVRVVEDGEGKAAVGPTARYGGIHEFGGEINIRSHSRLASVREVKVGKRKFRRAERVRAHERSATTITMPARPYLRPAFTEHMAAVGKAIVDAMIAYLKRGKG